MSRIGSLPILIPDNVEVIKTGKHLMVKGDKGSLEIDIDQNINVEIENKQLFFRRKNDQKKVKALHGLTRSLVANMIEGVTKGWSNSLQLVGVGFRAQTTGNKIILNVGFSHPVEVEAPTGITFEVVDNTKIVVSGIDKQLVGQVAANLKKVRAPDVYKGKGIRYEGEYIRKKVGKAGKVGAAAAGGSK
ncbi:50S ribosomal protein L6 [Candidatus Daviesbacteria bacterium]|nr:50S ribosomal protein L6 [Candidatus Daviesbacteria bacterium]